MRRLRLVVPVVLLSLVAGCSPSRPGGMPDATEAVGRVVEALANRDASTVPTEQKAAEVDYELKLVTEGMGAVKPSVVVAGKPSYDANAKRATQAIDVSWPLGAKPWQYQSTITMSLVDGQWRWNWSPQTVYPKLGKFSKLEWTDIPATRGRILGAGGVSIVEPHTVYDVGLDKANTPVGKQESSARALAALVGINADDYLAKVRASGPQGFVVALTFRDLPPAGIDAIPGVLAAKNSQHLTVTKNFAGGLYGTVGVATKDDMDKSGGAIRAGQLIGQSGLEKQHDGLLRGQDGYRVDLVKRDENYTPTATPGATVEILPALATKVESVDGKDLVTTIDKDLQLKLEAQLATADTPTSLVLVQPSTGKILAMASGPTGQTTVSPSIDRRPPASTFKTVSSLALFRKGYTADSSLDCSRVATVNGQIINNYEGYPTQFNGTLTVRESYYQSCNTAFINARDVFGHDGLVDAGASLGFGVDYDTGFPADYGHIPDAPGPNEFAAQTFGQGTVQASALALSALPSSVSAGHTVVPWLVEGFQPQIKATPLTEPEVANLRSLMTHHTAQFPGAPFIGSKTGTAEYVNADGKPGAHGWLIGYTGNDVSFALFQYDTLGHFGSQETITRALS